MTFTLRQVKVDELTVPPRLNGLPRALSPSDDFLLRLRDQAATLWLRYRLHCSCTKCRGKWTVKTCQIALNLLLDDYGHPETSRSLRPVLVGQQGPLKLQDFHMISVLDSVKK